MRLGHGQRSPELRFLVRGVVGEQAIRVSSSFGNLKNRLKLPPLKGGASGKCKYDYRIGFPLRPCLTGRKAGHPADLPVKRRQN